jgi:hypothetical protein
MLIPLKTRQQNVDGWCLSTDAAAVHSLQTLRGIDDMRCNQAATGTSRPQMQLREGNLDEMANASVLPGARMYALFKTVHKISMRVCAE